MSKLWRPSCLQYVLHRRFLCGAGDEWAPAGKSWTLSRWIQHRCVFNHSSRACKSTALCVHCGESGHEAAHCKNQNKCINCKGDHSASSRECPKWKLEKRIQQIKVERGISFPHARKAVPSEQSANTSYKRTAASVVSSATIKTTQQTQKKTTSTSTQTELTWPEGTDSPVPVKNNGKSQTTQTYKKQDNTKPGNRTSQSPLPRAIKAGTAPTPSTGKGGQWDGPSPPTVHFYISKEKC